jgi:predicted TIM-barrel enzyme
MTTRFASIFPGEKPIIAMVHSGALPVYPLYAAGAGRHRLVEGIRKDLQARGH